ncbi:hypothetical protein AB205_0055520 [Aquarana catesbeiana]|uniref:Uncharacterized protein n=1 Tax=Aquarana catesbeiana TaxID=8400 RepID=A0A2G9R4S0_AQUCT|nr:hypothetical protein AB205_0055520 [Aquarana catesbeiana]
MDVMSGIPRRDIFYYLLIVSQKIMSSHRILQEEIQIHKIYITDLPVRRHQWIPLIRGNLLINHIL